MKVIGDFLGHRDPPPPRSTPRSTSHLFARWRPSTWRALHDPPEAIEQDILWRQPHGAESSATWRPSGVTSSDMPTEMPPATR